MNNSPPQDKIPTGFPSPAAGHAESRLSTDDYLISNPTSTFYMRMPNDSMIGAGIQANDVLVIDRSVNAAFGMVVVIELDGKFKAGTLGKNMLMMANAAYPHIHFNEDQVIVLFGVVTGLMRKPL